jgi:chromate reductase
MITIISATNRPNSNSLKIAKKYAQLIDKQGIECRLFSLENLPTDVISSDLYSNRSENFQQLLDKYILPAQKLVFIVPEYNGSFPGVLKVFLDAVPPDTNRGKKVALIGIASGRAGNIRGLDHLTGVLNYLGMHILPNKLPISSVLTVLGADGTVEEENTIKALEKQLAEFISW